MDFETVSQVIEAARAAEAAQEPLGDVDQHGLGAALVWGLLVFEGPDAPPIVMHAAEQFLAVRGDVDEDVLTFLPMTFDDLDVRAAVLEAGTQLVDEFRAAILAGGGAEHAAGLVPPAFRPIVDERLTLDLYAAAAALMARLAGGQAAGCVAEEILAVELLRNAEGILEAQGRADAAEELFALFDLFGDDDVLRLFRMKEPGDAALAGHSDADAERGVVDQRPQAWFAPFGDVPLTGHLAETPA